MKKTEYEELKSKLLNKRIKGQCLNNREEGYNTGIETAVSIVRRMYKEQHEK